jgi:hypothetical protein
MHRTADRQRATSRRDVAASTTSRENRARFAAGAEPWGTSTGGKSRRSVIHVDMPAMQPRVRAGVSRTGGAARNHGHAGGSTGDQTALVEGLLLA